MKTYVTIVIFAACCAALLTGCGGGSPEGDSVDPNPQTTQEVAVAFGADPGRTATTQPVHCQASAVCH